MRLGKNVGSNLSKVLVGALGRRHLLIYIDNHSRFD